ncbi:hypothetical protein EW146_g7598 [Bondarzewia mesenterica]|uniref:Diphthine--ammonia ligase n=1 Tax=Bondarzewia mesenterica TaxID=1095465 RepID=A0A4S4LKC3_9AGAM|nr:hypothetical protein EW146_g7598 [Bondarzewia mesenterica]
MKYVALLSGGKDSCYNLLHCARNGHELVAAASLGPEHGKEELDSYLYQTVGQDAIEFVARALDVPLYRRIISGTAVEQGSEYGGRDVNDYAGTKGDETEDLYALLSTVKSEHPDIQGVSVGAILSSYQRVRVEHVCRRLSLTPLCYLWQRDQGELLSEMIEAGMEAILIKVAGIGLTTQHLGKTLAQMESTLTKLNNLYGSHVCGEGGEYESLTLDCPLFKKRITLLDTETVIHSDNDFATVAFLRIKDARLEPKTDTPIFHVPVPELLDEDFARIPRLLLDSERVREAQAVAAQPVVPESSLIRIGPETKRIGDWISLADICIMAEMGEISLEDEVRACFHILQNRLKEHSLLLSHLANINMFISSMELFAPINAVYSTFFGTSPPARACVAVDLPSSIRMKLDCIAYAEHAPADRQALHVQGLSYWAPANIGPYSQAIIADERIFISGQIGLIPSSLSLPSPQSLGMETALSSQHVHRVVNALQNNSGGGWEEYAQTVLYWLANEDDVARVRQALGDNTGVLTIYLVIKDLPKGALIEKQVLYHTGRGVVIDEDGDSTVVSQEPSFDQGDLSSSNVSVHWETSRFSHTGAASAVLCCRGEGDVELLSLQLKSAAPFAHVLDNALSIRLFHRHALTSSIKLYDKLFDHSRGPAVTPVYCRKVFINGHQDWDYVMSIIAS